MRAGVLGLLVATTLWAQSGAQDQRRTEIQTPYEIQVRVWRDQQPGDEPRLHVSARFAPRKDAALWSEVDLAGLRLRTGRSVWTPEDSSIEALPDGVFEVRGQGEATVEAGAAVVPVVQLKTSAGSREVVLPETVIETVE